MIMLAWRKMSTRDSMRRNLDANDGGATGKPIPDMAREVFPLLPCSGW